MDSQQDGREETESCACSACRRGGVRRPSSRCVVEEREICPKLKYGVSSSKVKKKKIINHYEDIVKHWN